MLLHTCTPAHLHTLTPPLPSPLQHHPVTCCFCAVMATTHTATRRLLHDLKELKDCPVPGVAAAPSEDSLFEWHINLRATAAIAAAAATVQGASHNTDTDSEDSEEEDDAAPGVVGPGGAAAGAFAGAVAADADKDEREGLEALRLLQDVHVHLVAHFPEDYPLRPPTIHVLTPVPHANVLPIGNGNPGYYLCLDMLEITDAGPYRGWTSAYTVASICRQLQSFLLDSKCVGCCGCVRVLLCRVPLTPECALLPFQTVVRRLGDACGTRRRQRGSVQVRRVPARRRCWRRVATHANCGRLSQNRRPGVGEGACPRRGVLERVCVGEPAAVGRTGTSAGAGAGPTGWRRRPCSPRRGAYQSQVGTRRRQRVVGQCRRK